MLYITYVLEIVGSNFAATGNYGCTNNSLCTSIKCNVTKLKTMTFISLYKIVHVIIIH